jgi:hypothetical protein
VLRLPSLADFTAPQLHRPKQPKSAAGVLTGGIPSTAKTALTAEFHCPAAASTEVTSALARPFIACTTAGITEITTMASTTS